MNVLVPDDAEMHWVELRAEAREDPMVQFECPRCSRTLRFRLVYMPPAFRKCPGCQVVWTFDSGGRHEPVRPREARVYRIFGYRRYPRQA